MRALRVGTGQDANSPLLPSPTLVSSWKFGEDTEHGPADNTRYRNPCYFPRSAVKYPGPFPGKPNWSPWKIECWGESEICLIFEGRLRVFSPHFSADWTPSCRSSWGAGDDRQECLGNQWPQSLNKGREKNLSLESPRVGKSPCRQVSVSASHRSTPQTQGGLQKYDLGKPETNSLNN